MNSMVYVKNSTGKKNHTLALLFILMSFITLHKYSMSFVVFELKIDYLFLFVYFFIYYRDYSKYFLNHRLVSKVIYIFFFLAFWNIISVITGIFFTDYPAHIADLTMSFKYLFMLGYFMFGGILTLLRSRINLTLIFQFISVFMIVVGLLEFFNKGFSTQLHLFYGVGGDEISMLHYRIVGTLKNSNNVGVISSLLILLLLYTKQNVILKNSIITGLVLIIFLTGSRTGTVLLLVIFLLYFIGNYFSVRNIIILLFVASGIILTAIYLIDFKETVLYSRVLDTKVDEMFYNRKLFYWNKTYKIIQSSPIMGVGLLVKGDWTVDNFFLNLLKTNGLIGLLVYLYFLFSILVLSIRNFTTNNDAKILFGIIIIIMLSSVSGDFYLSNYIFPIFFILIGLYTHSLLNISKVENHRDSSIAK